MFQDMCPSNKKIKMSFSMCIVTELFLSISLKEPFSFFNLDLSRSIKYFLFKSLSLILKSNFHFVT